MGIAEDQDMATAQLSSSNEEYLLLDNISWSTYERLLRESSDRRIRFTYDEGSLEIMTLGLGHEKYKKLISWLIETLAMALNIPIAAGGSTTLKRKENKKGLEADECYWIKNEALMRDKEDFDIRRDPPPDLAVEVDISHSSLDRMAIYAALRVPEVWRYDGKTLTVYQLGADCKYAKCNESLSFPWLPIAEVERVLGESKTRDQTSITRSFHAWVRSDILPLYQESSAKGRRPGKRNGRKKPSGD